MDDFPDPPGPHGSRLKRNAALLRKAGDRIVEDPRSYEQSTWLIKSDESCGTRGCVAGHLIDLCERFSTFRGRNSAVWDKEEECWRPIELAAREAAGLTAPESLILFSASWEPREYPENSSLAENVRSALYAIADGASVESVSGPWRRPWE